MQIIRESKQYLRAHMRSVMKEASHTKRMRAGRAVASSLLSWLEFLNRPKAELNIAYFANLDDEIDTTQLDSALIRTGCKRFLPVVGPSKSIFLQQIPFGTSINLLKTGHFNIAVPPKEAFKIGVEKLDALVLPGLAFDKKGNRLGRGKGYYDRLLASLENSSQNPTKIGFALDCQIVDEIYTEHFDKPVDWLCTPGFGIKQIS